MNSDMHVGSWRNCPKQMLLTRGPSREQPRLGTQLKSRTESKTKLQAENQGGIETRYLESEYMEI